MTTLAERFTANSEPEGDPVTQPYRPSMPANPWWGIQGLDPSVPVADWALAAQCTAMACAAYVFGTGAGYAERLLSRKGAPVRQWTEWLLQAAGPEDAERRRLALRLTCEQAQALDADAILEDARHLLDSCMPGRRR